MVFNEVLVDVNNLWRKFPRSMDWARRYGMRQVMNNLIGRPGMDGELRPGEFWAVKDVSFKLERGETLAILGLNGAGKSTVLKVIAGLMLPSRGEVRTRGSMDSLIELGTGFHPALSGRENVFIRCAFNGMNRAQTARMFEQIVEFAELREFIDMPVKNYSSGMYARLGFATAIFGRPDVLLVDEVLAVGDFTFRQKCMDKMNELKKHSAIVFVSHSFGQVRMFCDRGIVLGGGAKLFEGTAERAIDKLIEHEHTLERHRQAKLDKQRNVAATTVDAVLGPTFHNPDKIADVSCAWAGEHGEERNEFLRTDTIYLRYAFRLLYEPANCLIGVPVWNSNDELVTAFASDFQNVRFQIDRDGWVRGALVIEGRFNSGAFRAAIAIHDGAACLHRQHMPALNITGAHPRLLGSVQLAHRWA